MIVTASQPDADTPEADDDFGLGADQSGDELVEAIVQDDDDALEQQEANQDENQAEGQAEAEGKEKLFMDDLYAAISSVTKHVPKAQVKRDIVEDAYLHGVYFALKGTGIEQPWLLVTKWSVMRDVLREKVANAHAGLVPREVLVTLPPSLLAGIKPKAVNVLERLKGAFEDPTIVQAFNAFCTENDLMDSWELNFLAMDLPIQSMKACMDARKTKKATLSTTEIVKALSDMFSFSEACANFRTCFQALAPSVAEIANEKAMEAPKAYASLFKELEMAGAFCENRSHYTMACLKQVASNSAIGDSGFRTNVEHLFKKYTDTQPNILGAIDLHKKFAGSAGATDEVSWENFWITAVSLAHNPSDLEIFFQQELAAIAKCQKEARSEYTNAEKQKNAGADSSASGPADQAPAAAAAPAAPQELDESALDGLVSVEECFTQIGRFWEELMPRKDDDPTALKKKLAIAAQLRVQLVEVVLHEIEAYLRRKALLKQSQQCDNHLGLLLIDETQCKPGVFVKGGRIDLRMNFMGQLSLVPVLGSFRIATIDGNGIYMRNSCPKGPITGFVNTAWMVRTVEIHPETGDALEEATMNLLYDKDELSLEYALTLHGKEQKKKLALHLPYLKMMQNAAAMAVSFELTREPCQEHEVMSFDAAESPCAPGSGSMKSFKKKVAERNTELKEKLRNSNKTDAKDLKKWKTKCPHLLA